MQRSDAFTDAKQANTRTIGKGSSGAMPSSLTVKATASVAITSVTFAFAAANV